MVLGHASLVSGSRPLYRGGQDVLVAREDRLSKDEGVLAAHGDVVNRNDSLIPSARYAPIKNSVPAASRQEPYLNKKFYQVAVQEVRENLDEKFPKPLHISQAKIPSPRVEGIIEGASRIHHRFRWLWKSDWEIKQDTRRALTLNPSLAQARIRVHVEDGEVTLRGTVQDRKQSHLAQRAALGTGARSVRNRLETLPLY